jgi:transposase
MFIFVANSNKMKVARKITVEGENQQELEKWIHSQKIERRLLERARIILLASQGKSNKVIAELLQTREATVSKWRNRFILHGLKGLQDKLRSGKPREYSKKDEKRILSVLDEKPPKGYSVWSGGLISGYLKDVSKDYVWKVLKKYGIQLQRKHSWCVSTDPEFAKKSADIVGLYLNPPEKAVVICVDEKPAIQALERAQGWLKLPNGKAITGFNHEYKRHGTTTLFAALEVATGLVKTEQFNRRRRKEFLEFMNEVVGQYGDKEIHVILDNLSTHKPKNDKWLMRHKNVTFHYTPTHASWLNQIEVWFSILSRQALKNRSFNSKDQLVQGIIDYEKAYNKKASPFEWTKTVVFPTKFEKKLKYADLCN